MSVISPVMIVLAHPRPASLDHELARRVQSMIKQAGVRQHFHDLYAESFDPVLTEDDEPIGEVWSRGTSSEQVRGPTTVSAATAADPLVQRHRRELAEAKALVAIHPDWLGKPPAIMTGWLDRVLLSGSKHPAPILQRALVINTSEDATLTPPVTDALGLLWRDQLGPYLGSPKFERLPFRGTAAADAEQLGRWYGAAERATAWVCGADR